MIKYLRNIIFCLLLVFLFGSCFCRGTACDKSKETNATEICTDFATDPPYFYEDPDEKDTLPDDIKEKAEKEEKEEEEFILNVRSKKIHKLTCGTASLILPENREDYTGRIEELYEIGYTQCGNCFK